MKHYLTFKDEKSDKFWWIETDGTSFTVSFGKVGSTGQKQTKTFDSKEQCLVEAKKLLKDKLKKGYVEEGGNSVRAEDNSKSENDHLKTWQSIVDAKNISSALEDHFSYLADTPEAKKLLCAIMKEVKAVSCDSKCLKVTFGKLVLSATPPAQNISKKYPTSFQHLLRKHGTVHLSGNDVTLGEHQKFDLEDGWFDAVEDEDDELWVFAKTKNVVCPIDAGTSGNFWIYHPNEKNTSGQPMIYYLEHDGTQIKDPQKENAGSLFVYLLAKQLNVTIDDTSVDKQPNDPETWWNNLGQTWQKIFDENIWKNTELGFSKEKVNKIKALDRVTINRSAVVPDLKPLLFLPNLKMLRIYGNSVGSLEVIAQKNKLKELELDGPEGYALNILAGLVNLEKLQIQRSDAVASLDDLKNLSKLKVLKIAIQSLRSIDVVINFPKLESLEIDQTTITDISVLSKLPTLTHIALPASVNTLKPLMDLRKLYYLNIRTCKMPMEEMVDFVNYRKDGFQLLANNNDELLHKSFKHNFNGIDQKLTTWTLSWAKVRSLSKRSILILVGLCNYLESAKITTKDVKLIGSAKDLLEQSMHNISPDDATFVYEEFKNCLKEMRFAEAEALTNVLILLVEKDSANANIKISGATLRNAVTYAASKLSPHLKDQSLQDRVKKLK